MNERIMLNWLEICFESQTSKSLLIMGNFGVHCMRSVIDKIKEKNVEIFLLPPCTTHYTQPLDVGLNCPFKTTFRDKWEHWSSTSTPLYTKKGYRKSRTYQNVVDFVKNTLNTINRETIYNSFTSCGIIEKGSYIAPMKMNKRLKKIVENDDDTDLSISLEIEELPTNIASILCIISLILKKKYFHLILNLN